MDSLAGSLSGISFSPQTSPTNAFASGQGMQAPAPQQLQQQQVCSVGLCVVTYFAVDGGLALACTIGSTPSPHPSLLSLPKSSHPVSHSLYMASVFPGIHYILYCSTTPTPDSHTF